MSAPLIILRRLAFAGCLAAGGLALAQTPADEHAAQIAARYEAMLAANPAEGIALDRLWKNAQERGAADALIERHRLAAASGNAADALIYGRLLQLAGRPEDAAAAYRQAAGRDPASPLPLLALAELAQPGDAPALYEAALAKLPAGDRREPGLLLKLGAALLAAGHPREAAESWERLAARRPDDPALRRRLVQTYEAHGLPDRAIVHLEYLQAHAAPAERVGALRDLARLREARGDFDPAREALESGLALTARDHWLHAEMARSLIRLYGRASRAAELQARWEAKAEKSPQDLDALGRLETLARERGDPAARRRWLEKIVALSPGNGENARQLARLLADAGERERAAAIYDGLLKLRPNDRDLTLARAELDLQMMREAAAVDRLNALPGDDALAFFLRHHLDAAAERRLRAEVAAQPAAEEPPLALARFLFSQRRPADGRAALEAMIAAAPDPAARLARLGRAADAYRQAGQLDEALRCWREAAKLAPAAPGPVLSAADALAARGDLPGAADALRRAFDLTAPGAARLEVDRRWFDLLDAAPDPARAPPGRPRRLAGSLPGERRKKSASPGLKEQIEALAKAAHDQPTAENYLRLARWHSWAHAAREAAAAAGQAAELEPSNLPARELLISLAVENGDREEAARHLREMLTLDPERRTRWLKALADLRIEEGDGDRALAVYQELARATPGSVEALTELALAQQRADRWYDATATWERACALPGLTPPQRAETRRALLTALERLGEFPRARDLLQAAVDGATTPAEKRDGFHQLADFCAKHGLTATLVAHYEERLAAQPLDFFGLTALAELRRGQGRPDEAYALLQRALYSAPDPAETLPALVDAAEALGDAEAAIAHQRHLVALSRDEASEAAERLARLQAAHFDDDAAAKIWEGLAAKFPRDAGVLGRAADFFEAAGDPARARKALRQLAGFDASDGKRLYRLGQLDAAAGDLVAARRWFEAALAATEPEKAGEPPQTPPVLSKPLPKLDDRTLRLSAIRAAAQILPETERRAWIARWQKAAAAGARNEPLWAFMSAGAKPEASALLAHWAAENPGNEAVEEMFIRLSLRLGEGAAVARWTWGNDPAGAAADRVDRMLNGLTQFLLDGEEPDAHLLGDLFPPGCSREARWKAASLVFAARQRYAEAIALGGPVVGEVAVNRCNYAVEVAGWNLLLGRAPDARAILREAINVAGADSFAAVGDPYFTAVREYWMLLPEAERGPFAESLLRRGARHDGPAQAALTRALLHALSGDRAAANSALDDLIGLRLLGGEAGSVDSRRWNYLLVNGAQLISWNLDFAAIHLWRRALAEASLFQWQDAECRTALGEMRAQLALAEILNAPGPTQAGECLDDYLRSRPDPAAAHNLAGGLAAAARPSLAARVHEHLGRVDPADPDPARELLEAYAAAGDSAAVQRTLRRLLEERPGKRPAGLQPPDLAVRLAEELERDGDGEGARRVLARQFLANPRAVGVGLALARREQRTGRIDEAATVLRGLLPADAGLTARIALADLEAARGNTPEAKRLLQEGAARTGDPLRAETGARLISLCLAENDRAAAWDAARDPAAAALAAGRVDAKDPAVARELYAIALRRAADPAARFAAQRGALAFAGAAEFPRELARLRRLAGDDPALLGAWEDTRFKQARAHGLDAWLEGELQTDWAGGRGNPAAGAKLIDLYLATGQSQRLAETVRAIGVETDAGEPTAYLVQAALLDKGRADLAGPLIERLSRRLPQNEQYALAWVRALWKAGQLAEADRVCAELSAASPVRGNIEERIARLFLDLGDRARALAWYRRVEPNTSAEAHLALARLGIEHRDLPAARRELRAAYRMSETADLTPLVDWLGAAGRLEDERRAPGGDFPLSPRERGALAVLIFDRLADGGNPKAARRMAMAHPEWLAAAPELAGRLCAGASREERPGIIAALEGAVVQRDPPPPRLERELAEACVRRAAEVPEEAPTLLARAHGLRPDDFDIARKLAERLLADHQPARAAEALQAFTGKDALPADQQAARALLAHK